MSSGTVREVLFSLLSLMVTKLRPMVKQYVDEIIASQQLPVQHTLLSEHTSASKQPAVPEQAPVSEPPAVSGHTSASVEDETTPGAVTWRWKPFLIAASILTVVKTKGLNR